MRIAQSVGSTILLSIYVPPLLLTSNFTYQYYILLEGWRHITYHNSNSKVCDIIHVRCCVVLAWKFRQHRQLTDLISLIHLDARGNGSYLSEKPDFVTFVVSLEKSRSPRGPHTLLSLFTLMFLQSSRFINNARGRESQVVKGEGGITS